MSVEKTVPFPIGVVVSRFNESITRALTQGVMDQLEQEGFSKDLITVITVPGAVEIPLVVKKLAQSGRVKAVIALGAVIRGETDHYELVCQQVSQGCQRVALDCEIPVIFEVLATHNEVQAWERAGGLHGHKGKSAVKCAIEMVGILAQLS
ncbi:MAG: 6,7-dimethyl-8-ribityllumazine synthase [Gammaproteobacteria bacterium]|nr:6,7-dimethyl-8-ribityllumazine synthase [Gammaproteobacteria bacterium]